MKHRVDRLHASSGSDKPTSSLAVARSHVSRHLSRRLPY